MNTINISPVVNAVIALLAAIVTSVLVPWLKAKLSAEKYQKLLKYAKVAVTAAEQLYDKDATKEKREYVDDYLWSLGYTIDSTVDNAVEAAVLELHESLNE